MIFEGNAPSNLPATFASFLIPLSKWILFNDPFKTHMFCLGRGFFAGIFLGKTSTPKITGKVVERLKRFLVEDWVIVWELMMEYGRKTGTR